MSGDSASHNIDFSGDFRRPTTTVSADTTLTVDDMGTRYSVDTTSGDVTMTLPLLAQVNDGAEVVFYKTVAANSMIIDGNGAETIEGSANVTRTAQYAYVMLRKASTVWQLIKSAQPDGDLVSTNNLSDVNDASAAAQNIGALEVANDLSDLSDAATARSNLGIDARIQEYTLDVDFSDLGSGASDTIALAAFPTNVWVLGAYFEINTEFAGEADLAMIVGDTANDDELVAGPENLNAVAAGTLVQGTGALSWGTPEADYAGDGAAATFTATELDDVSAGNLTITVMYIAMQLHA